MANAKKQGQRLIPEYLLKYTEKLENKHPDPEAEWGAEYSAGTGIDITGSTISIDEAVVATKTDLEDYVTGTSLTATLTPYAKINDDTQNITAHSMTVTPGGGYIHTTYSATEISMSIPRTPGYTLTIPTKDGTLALTSDIPDVSEFVTQTTLTAELANYVPSSSITTVAYTGSYNDLSNKPTIPTATSQLTNDSGFISGITSGDVTTALGYTPTNPSSLATVATSGSYNDLIDKPNTPDLITIELTSNSGTLTTDELNLISVNKEKTIIYGRYAGYNYYQAFYRETTSDTATYSTISVNMMPVGGEFTRYVVEVYVNLNNGSYTVLRQDTDVALKSNLATVATSGSYNDLTDKPTIPTVNDNTITITQGGVTKGSFTLNQNTNATIDVDDVPGMIGEVLFSDASGSTDLTLTMAHSFADYSYVDIQWINNDGITNSTRIYDPNGKTVNLLSANVVSTLYIDKAGIFDLSGTSMTQVSKGQGAMVNGNNSIVDYKDNTQTIDYIKITKVIGYKQNSAPIVIPTVPTHTTLFNTTPTAGTTPYSILLSDSVTNYDEIIIYYYRHNSTVTKSSLRLDSPSVGDLFYLLTYETTTNPRLYTKADQFTITDATHIDLVDTIQQRIGNNEATNVGLSTTEMRCKPYKIVGIKYN